MKTEIGLHRSSIKIRVSAYAGIFDDSEAKDTIQTGEYAAGLTD